MEHIYRKIRYTIRIHVNVEISYCSQRRTLRKGTTYIWIPVQIPILQAPFRVDEPGYSNVSAISGHDWEHSVYGKHEEDIPEDASEPLGRRIVLTHYFDASLMYDILSGKAVTGMCTFYNKTAIDWYCKQQSTSETVTYGAEFLSGRKCCENIIDQ